MVSDGEAGGGFPLLQPREPEMLERDHLGLLERVPAVIYVADTGPAGRWRYVSPQIQPILGFTPEEWCANTGLWAARLHPADRDWVLSSELEASREEPHAAAAEYRIMHRDGRVVWIRDDASLVSDGEGSPRWHGVLSDITDRKRVEAELERRAAQQAAVAQLGEHALEGASTSELMHEAVSAAAEFLGVETATVLELLPDEGCFVVRAGLGIPGSDLGTVRVPGGSASQSGYTILIGAAVAVEDWEIERRFARSPILQRMGSRSGLTVPIEGRTGGPFGVLGVQSLGPLRFGPGDIDFLQSLANVLADAFERQAIEDDIRHRALHDPLTGLPNRVLFLDRVEHALARLQRRGSLAAVLFLDFDHFKHVNDSLGHQVGDELLAAAAPRLKQALRAGDTVARLGGDEFGILLEDISSEEAATEMAQRIAAMLSRPFAIGGSEHFATASIGIAFAHGGELAEKLIGDADAAMYRAKERGRARYELFDELMRARAKVRMRVEADLGRAMERGELRLDYQPVVALSDGSIVGAEALLRWDHPERGLIEPTEFIPVAEENGLIEPIGRWVLERACRQAARWHRMRPDAAPIHIHVNLSAVQVVKRNLPELVAAAVQASGIDPGCVHLEITETVMLGDAETLTDTLHALKALGVRLVLDDFGTGYSSLGYLTRLPLDALKVDRSFVDGLGAEPRDTAITEAIIAMSRALSLEVIAEGVETRIQADALLALGCRLAQGFYFSQPVSPGEMSRLLRTSGLRVQRPNAA